jgi:hypothetical protein
MKVLRLLVKPGREGKDSYDVLKFFANNIKALGQAGVYIEIKKVKPGRKGKIKAYPALIVNKDKIQLGPTNIYKYVNDNLARFRQQGGGQVSPTRLDKGYVPYGAMAFGDPSLDNFYSAMMTPERKKMDDVEEGLSQDDKIDESKIQAKVQRESSRRGIGQSDQFSGGRGPRSPYAEKATMASNMDEDMPSRIIRQDDDNIGDPLDLAVSRRGHQGPSSEFEAIEDPLDRALLSKGGEWA